jgi:hypothetical protein
MELKTKVFKLDEGERFTSEDGVAYVITDDHTIADISRWLLTQTLLSVWVDSLTRVDKEG